MTSLAWVLDAINHLYQQDIVELVEIVRDKCQCRTAQMMSNSEDEDEEKTGKDILKTKKQPPPSPKKHNQVGPGPTDSPSLPENSETTYYPTTSSSQKPLSENPKGSKRSSSLKRNNKVGPHPDSSQTSSDEPEDNERRKSRRNRDSSELNAATDKRPSTWKKETPRKRPNIEKPAFPHQQPPIPKLPLDEMEDFDKEKLECEPVRDRVEQDRSPDSSELSSTSSLEYLARTEDESEELKDEFLVPELQIDGVKLDDLLPPGVPELQVNGETVYEFPLTEDPFGALAQEREEKRKALEKRRDTHKRDSLALPGAESTERTPKKPKSTSKRQPPPPLKRVSEDKSTAKTVKEEVKEVKEVDWNAVFSKTDTNNFQKLGEQMDELNDYLRMLKFESNEDDSSDEELFELKDFDDDDKTENDDNKEEEEKTEEKEEQEEKTPFSDVSWNEFNSPTSSVFKFD